MQTAGLLALLHLNMRSPLRIQEIVSRHTPEGLNPEKSLELQKFAISLSNDVQSVLGQAVKDELLSTPANVAPLFLRNQISKTYTRLSLASASSADCSASWDAFRFTCSPTW